MRANFVVIAMCGFAAAIPAPVANTEGQEVQGSLDPFQNRYILAAEKANQKRAKDPFQNRYILAEEKANEKRAKDPFQNRYILAEEKANE